MEGPRFTGRSETALQEARAWRGVWMHAKTALAERSQERFSHTEDCVRQEGRVWGYEEILRLPKNLKVWPGRGFFLSPCASVPSFLQNHNSFRKYVTCLGLLSWEQRPACIGCIDLLSFPCRFWVKSEAPASMSSLGCSPHKRTYQNLWTQAQFSC